MIVIISPEQDIPNELETLNHLFEEGLECFHLRKPHKDYSAHEAYLHQIDDKYHNRIVVHYYHELVNAFNLKGIHFQEQKRIDHIDNPGQYFKNLSLFGKTISSSFHDPKTIEACHFEFDYYLLSPVFTSISKADYEGQGFDVTAIDEFIVGMGGIQTETIEKTLQLGYKGIGVLGGVWNTANPVEHFKSIKTTFYALV